MQWSIDRNGGFSRANPASLVLPPIMDPLYGYQSVNVEAQSGDPHSLLNWTRRLLAVRKQQKAFGRGTLKMLSPSNRRILAYTRAFTDSDGKTETILCVANVSRSAQGVELDLSEFAGQVPVEMIGGNAFAPIGQTPFMLTLAPYGFFWFLLASENQMPGWHTAPSQSVPELVTLVLKEGLEDVLKPPVRTVLEQTVLPGWLPNRRWFGHKEAPIEQVNIIDGAAFGAAESPVLLTELEVTCAGQPHRYQVPLGTLGEEQANTAVAQQVVSRMRRGRHVGFLTDAFTQEAFVRAVLSGLTNSQTVSSSAGDIHFSATQQLATLGLDEHSEVRYLTGEQSNSSVVVGGVLVLKLLRQLHSGQHPELEMGDFLTRAGYPNISPLLGSVLRRDAQGEDTLLMIAQGYLSNQGDAWSWTHNTLERAIRDELADAQSENEQHYNALAELAEFARVLGQRLGEMHSVLAQAHDNPDFAPHFSTLKDTQRLATHITEQVKQALQQLKAHLSDLPAAEQQRVKHLIDQQGAINAYIQQLAADTQGGLNIRVHGDLHLGQVLVVQGDAFFIDFEGEPSRSLAERRAKHSPYKDVSGLLRSFDYAGAMAISNVQQADHSPEADEARQRVVQRYLNDARHALIDAYRLATASLNFQMKSPRGQESALALMSLEKAAYEVIYEAANRPAWLRVPLQGLSELLAHLPSRAKPLPDGEK